MRDSDRWLIYSFIPAQSLWYRIHIPGGRRLGQEFILRELSSRASFPIKIFNFHLDAQIATFFVKESKAANELRKLNNIIVTPTGTKMPIIVRPSDLPQVQSITDVMENAIKRGYLLTHVLRISRDVIFNASIMMRLE